jgi:hypothetical protein
VNRDAESYELESALLFGVRPRSHRLPRLNDAMANDEYLTSDFTLQVHRCFGLDHVGLSRKVAFPEESSSWKAMWIRSWLGMRQSLNTEVSEKATVISNYPMSLS